MMAAVAVGAYPDMEAAIGHWVVPHLGALEAPDMGLVQVYDHTYPTYKASRLALAPVWGALAQNGAHNAA